MLPTESAEPAEPMSPRATGAGWLWLPVAGAAAHVAIVIFVALSRMAYPFELEWMEGASLESARRLFDGKPLYVRPSLEFIPSMYTPLYFWLSAGAMRMFGTGFLPLRLVSLASSMGCGAIIAAFVRRESGSLRGALLAAGLFAAAYRAGGAFYDLARIDMLFLLLALGAIEAIRRWPGRAGWTLAGALFSAAWLAKQTTMVVVAPIFVVALMERRGRALWLILPALLPSFLAAFALNRASEGWFRFYVHDIVFGQRILYPYVVWFWTNDLAWPMPLALTAAGAALAWRMRRKPDGGARDWALAAIVAGMVGAAWVSRFKAGGYKNTVIPAYAMVAILAGIAWAELERRAGASPRAAVWRRVMGAAALAQFVWLIQNPFDQIPTAADRQAGEKLVSEIAAINGAVMVPFHPYLARMAGKPSHAFALTIDDIAGGDRGPTREALAEELRQALRARRYAAVILDVKAAGSQPWTWSWRPELELSYRRDREILGRDEPGLWPKTGWKSRPSEVFVPRAEAPTSTP